ncbi:fimbrial protein [Serratia quinivorans]|uniref:fimbrial protein n=1 Tax=Serratia quinivorans TaxID=137545 RepID=UPI002179CCF8|nr:fimbrial protein [Serratia quinivorans]CAI1691024.1 Type-1A pilin [Serratia quinivorans]CAI1773216.1 Type-1A pilin [Serratia quinivorans]
MKKTLIAAALATTTIFSVSSAFAADGTLNFTGDIKDTTCVVDLGGTTSLSIPMGTFNKTAFSGGSGTVSNATKFSIKLKTCPAAYTKATIEFDGTADSNNDQVLALTAGTVTDPTATGVGIQISDKSGSVLPLKTESASYDLTAGTSTADNVNSLDFTARYIATATAVTSGKANATASFIVKYN